MRLKPHTGIYISVGIWCLMVVVLANAYAGTLLSYLSVVKLGQPINSMNELAKSKTCQLIVQGGEDLVNDFLNATHGTLKSIGDSLRKHPENVIYKFDRDSVKVKLMNGSYALLHIDVVNYGLIESTYRENGKKGRMTFAKETVGYPLFISTLLNKNSPYTEAYNRQLQWQIEAGLIAYNLQQKSMPRIDQCKMENQKGSASYKPLSLWGMSSAFIVLALGLSLASLLFLLELVYKQFTTQRN